MRASTGFRITGAVILALVLVGQTVASATEQRATPKCNGLTATIVGTSGDDFLAGTSGDDVIVGLDGDDTLIGAGGDDTICGGAGNDIIAEGPGDDFIHGNSGFDLLEYATWTSPITANFGSKRVLGGPSSTDQFQSIERLEGTGLDDVLIGNAGPNELLGGPGNDVINGKGGDDLLLGGPGDDVIRGRSGDDVMNGGSGRDRVGFDQAPGDMVIRLDEQAAEGEGVDAVIGFEDVLGSRHADIILGDNGPNELLGGKGDDVLLGGAGNDVLKGNKGVDFAWGMAGSDVCKSEQKLDCEA